MEATKEIHRKIINDGKFWKLGKHNEPMIKTAFFNAISSIIANAVELLNDEKKRAVSSIVNTIDESDPCLATAVWEAFLVAMHKIQVIDKLLEVQGKQLLFSLSLSGLAHHDKH